ncbi:MAG: MraY family glycosyltransferase [Candidatus Moraniibacteriota bacterium]
MDNLFLNPFVVSFLLAVVFLFGIIKIVKVQHFSEKNKRTSLRHLHQQGITRFGGVAIILAFVVTLLADSNLIISRQLLGVLLACGAILLVGLRDDFWELAWQKQLLFQFALASFVFALGIRLEYLTNPLGGVFFLNGNAGTILNFLIVVVWILLIINAMNWADGIDGVSGGISVIGALAIFLVSLRPEVNQPPVAIIAMALLGALLAFVFFNFNPAKILAGTSGSVFMGFMLAMLALFAGAKIATTLLVLAVPVLDALWVIAERYKAGASVFSPDQRHLHHRLLALGWSQRKICFFYWAVTALIAFLALNTRVFGKITLFGVVLLAMLAGYFFIRKKQSI